MLHRLYWPLSEAWMSRGCRNSGSWSRCSTEDTPLSPTQTALLHSLDAQTPPIWGHTEKRHHTQTKTRSNNLKKRCRAVKKKKQKQKTKGLLTGQTPQWLSRFSVSSQTHLYIHQTTPPSFPGSSRTQKLPTARQVESWMTFGLRHCKESQFIPFLTYFNTLIRFFSWVPYMWLQPLLGPSLQAVGLGFPAALSFSLYKAQQLLCSVALLTTPERFLTIWKKHFKLAHW